MVEPTSVAPVPVVPPPASTVRARLMAVVRTRRTARFHLGALWFPVTYTYLTLLVAVATTLTLVSAPLETRIVLHASTNLNNLVNGRISTFVSSALVVGSDLVTLSIVPLLGCLLALAERRFGAWKLVRTFLFGHIGATVLVAVGLWIAVESHWLPNSITHVEDVGVSYGAMAVVGALVVVLPRQWRKVWVLGWLAVALGGVFLWQTFTNVGHLVALCLGLVLGYFMLHRRAVPLHPLNRPEWALLLGGSALACVMLLG
ncbi:rhomboid-like protein [Nocardia jejuensis]|uniref:rhomboid-like protein n=1 Tax=Nocardia jejuensis TaxID=328049 RepID=UPI000A4FBDF1|nr:rhomboid-like protein [Nocardia jejuensis]